MVESAALWTLLRALAEVLNGARVFFTTAGLTTVGTSVETEGLCVETGALAVGLIDALTDGLDEVFDDVGAATVTASINPLLVISTASVLLTTTTCSD